MSAPAVSAATAAMPPQRPPFDGVTIGLHWATAVIVLAMFATAFLREQWHDDIARATLLELHRSLGLTVWVATALRLAWRLTKAALPPFPAHLTRTHRAVVTLSEYGLYALLLGQPATGLAATLLRGHPFALFGLQVPQLMPEDPALRAVFHTVHELGAWTLGALAAGHAAAALFHHFVLRDDVLHCMAPGIAAPATQPPLPGRVVADGSIAAQ